MASKKARNKKHNPGRAAAAMAKQYIKKVYCYDAKCYPEMQYNDSVLRSNLPMPIKQKIMYAVADDPLPWNIMLLTFETDGDKRWVTDWIMDKLPPASSNTLNTVLDGELERLVEQRNPKHLITWAWFAIPLQGADLDAMRDQIVEMFTNDGCFDRELCERVHAERVISERLEEVKIA